MSYTIAEVTPADTRMFRKMTDLLHQQNIRYDSSADYSCVILDDDYQAAATGSCSGNTLRCLAVSPDHAGEALTNTLISHLVEVQYARGNTHIFLYTKPDTARFFGDLGFYEIIRGDNIVFMENRRNGFSSYLAQLQQSAQPGRCAAIVMNANPFTLGHQYLVEKAAAENDTVHLFAVSEEKSPIPYAVRKQLITAGTAHLANVIIHDSGSYIISSATFPSYFQKNEDEVSRSHALVDAGIFVRIARAMNITKRYAGEEPFSRVTAIYNEVMQAQLPPAGVELVVVPRREGPAGIISASMVRQLIHDGDMDRLRDYLPASSLDYFLSPEAAPVITAIRAMADVVHH
ncbi:MAG: [Solobacterium sp.]|nr:[citrate (pro-3S)-lyase] ligase [Solobacterium sp.]